MADEIQSKPPGNAHVYPVLNAVIIGTFCVLTTSKSNGRSKGNVEVANQSIKNCF